MRNTEGQTSVEFLVLLAATIFVLTIVFTLSQTQVGDIIKTKDQNDAKNSVLDLSSAAKEVYAQGTGAKKQVYVIIPSSYEYSQSYVTNKTIKLRVRGTDYVSVEDFDVHGSLPTTAGAHWVWVISEGNKVRIGDAMISLSKNSIYIIMNKNTTATDSFSVTSIWNLDINVSGTLIWNPTNVTMGTTGLIFSLTPNQANQITLTAIASASAIGFYNGEIDFNATDGASNDSVRLPITVEVVGFGTETAPPLAIIPSVWNETLLGGQNVTKQFDVCTNSGTSLSSVTFTASGGSPGIWVGNLDSLSAINQNTCVPKIFSISVPNGTLSGVYVGTITAVGQGAANAQDSVTVYVTVGGNVTAPDLLGPIITMMNHTEYPTTLSNIFLGGTATDLFTGNNTVQGCNVQIDSGNWNALSPEDGAWDSPTENFFYNVGSLPVGYHSLNYQCTDSVGNLGGIYNDSIGITDVDLMLVLDRSGSMSEAVTNAVNNNVVSASSTGWSWVKSLTVTQKNGDAANVSVEIKASASGCTVFYNATIGGVQIATGNRTSTSYGTIKTSINVSGYTEPYTIDLWLKRNLAGCTASNRAFSLTQLPTKMQATKDSAKSFIDIAGNDIQAGLVSFSTSSTTDKTLAMMDPANQQALKNSIDALVPSGNTCIECGLESAANELTSSRARPLAKKVIVLLTDGISNVGDSVTGSVYCRDRNITVYTIGFGYNVDDTELTNIALLTYGDYYFAPNAQTLTSIFQNIGR